MKVLNRFSARLLLFAGACSYGQGYSQNVGIGTTTPGSKLHVITNSGSVPLRLQNTFAGSYTGIHFHSSDGPIMGHIGYANVEAPTLSNMFYAGSLAAVPFVLTAGDVERMRINPSGEVGIGTIPNSLAALDIASNSKGLLIPRLTTAERTGMIGSPKGLIVYDSTGNAIYYNDGTEWRGLSTSKTVWSLNGNAGTSATDFVGTTDNSPLRFRVANQEAGEINAATSNTFFGYHTGQNNDDSQGSFNTAIGHNALSSNVSGTNNVASGFLALGANTSGSTNIAGGNYSLYSNTTGSNNIAIGQSSLLSNSSSHNNIGIGTFAMYYTTGTDDVGIGTLAMYSNGSGNYNTGLGNQALYHSTASWYNTAVGYRSGYGNNMGYNNVFVGANTGTNAAGYFNCIGIGQAVTNTASSQARFGNAATNSIGGYANWTNISDGRFKKDVQQNVKGIDFILKLKPVTYHLDISGLSKTLNEARGKELDEFSMRAIAEKENILFSGFVAQDVEKAAEETGYDFSGVDKPKNDKDFYGIRYAEFVVPLVKAVQEQQAMIDQLKKELAELKKIINEKK